jgi:hypothetical protein
MTLGAGQSRTYVTYYGLAQLDIDLRPPLALGVSAPATLDALTSSYSPNPFEIVATVFNNGTATATDVQLTLNLTGTTGLTLTGGLLTQSIGDVAIGQDVKLLGAFLPIHKVVKPLFHMRLSSRH